VKLGPVRLQGGRLRIVVVFGADAGPNALLVRAVSDGEEATGPRQQWMFAGSGRSEVAVDLDPGRWSFPVTKTAAVPATVAIYEAP
jgi:hypothetical protein